MTQKTQQVHTFGSKIKNRKANEMVIVAFITGFLLGSIAVSVIGLTVYEHEYGISYLTEDFNEKI